MNDDDLEELDADYVEEEYESGFLRWMSVIVVLAAVAGFFALAWYAYRTGTQSVSNEDVPVVEAPKTAVKEAPADPGGLQFPHQDKTVYEAISGSGPKPAAERVLPAPEEPITPSNKESGTETWVSQKYNDTEQKLGEKGEEKVPASMSDTAKEEPVKVADLEEAKKTIALAEKEANPPASVNPSYAAAAPAVNEPVVKVEAAQPVKTVAKKESAAKSDVKKSEAKKPEVKKTEIKKTEVKKAAKTTGKGRVQLGAFKSEQEANSQWAKIYKANAGVIGNYTHDVVRADLGAKGVFYRLQLTGFAGKDDAKRLCTKLQAKKQACMSVN